MESKNERTISMTYPQKKNFPMWVCALFLFIIFVDDRRHPRRLSLYRRAVFFNTSTASHAKRINYSKSIVDPQRQQMPHGWVRSPLFSPTRGMMLRWSAKSSVIMSGYYVPFFNVNIMRFYCPLSTSYNNKKLRYVRCIVK